MRSIDRMDRVNANLLRLLSDIIRHELEAIDDLVTLTTVTTTRDLQNATIYVTAIDHAEEHVASLNKKSFEIRKQLKPLLDFKLIPNLNFVVDVRSHDITDVEAILDTLP